MQASLFNVRVPIETGDEVFLMNTFTDAQLIVSRDVVDLLDRVHGDEAWSDAEREAIEQLADHGFVVRDRAAERAELQAFFRDVREGTDTLKVTLLTADGGPTMKRIRVASFGEAVSQHGVLDKG